MGPPATARPGTVHRELLGVPSLYYPSILTWSFLNQPFWHDTTTNGQFPQQQFPYPSQPFQPSVASGGYGPMTMQFPAQQQPVVLATGNLDDFFGQPSVSGGPSWTFKDKPVGTSYSGIVARAVTNADIQQQTTPGAGLPATYRDGRPKWVMRVPVTCQPSVDFPDGEATWYVTGQTRDELVRAMSESGAPAGPPEPGAAVQVTLVARKPSRTPGFNPSNQVSVRYSRPPGSTATPTSATPAQSASPGAAPITPAQATPAAGPQPAPSPPGDLTPEQQALLARLTG